jgi:hypothetical protein
MEEAEYIDYLNQQLRDNPDESQKPIAQLSMYQMNKDLVRGLKKMNNMAINKALENVREWYLKYVYSNPTAMYFVLLNHEQHYYTMFTRDHKKRVKTTDIEADNFIAAVKDILTNYYGDNDIRAIDVDSNGAVEIWGMWDNEPSVAYLFPYDQGVVLY